MAVWDGSPPPCGENHCQQRKHQHNRSQGRFFGVAARLTEESMVGFRVAARGRMVGFRVAARHQGRLAGFWVAARWKVARSVLGSPPFDTTHSTSCTGRECPHVRDE